MEELSNLIYEILTENTDKLTDNTEICLLDYNDIDLDFKGKNYRIKIMELEEK